MRFCYLKLALLAGALASEAPADSTRLRVVHSYASDRDGFPVPTSIRDEKLVGVDDEERGYLTFAHFAKTVLLSDKYTSELVEKNAVTEVSGLIVDRASPSQILSDHELSHVSSDLLADKTWVKWAYFVCASHGSKNPQKNHEAIIRAMATQCGYDTLAKKLLEAATLPNSKVFANALIQMMIDHRLDFGYKPVTLLRLLRIDVKMDNFFESEQFGMLSHYLSVLIGPQYALNPYFYEFIVFHEWLEKAIFLKMLTSPGNAKKRRSMEYMAWLKLVWLNEKVAPYKVVFMLKFDKEQDYLFLNLEANGPASSFWVDYWWRFRDMYPGDRESLMVTLTKGLWPRGQTVLEAAKNAKDENTKNFAFFIERTSTL